MSEQELDILTNRAASLPDGGYNVTPAGDGRIVVTSGPMNVAMVASLHEHLGELIKGKIDRTEDGWRYRGRHCDQEGCYD